MIFALLLGLIASPANARVQIDGELIENFAKMVASDLSNDRRFTVRREGAELIAFRAGNAVSRLEFLRFEVSKDGVIFRALLDGSPKSLDTRKQKVAKFAPFGSLLFPSADAEEIKVSGSGYLWGGAIRRWSKYATAYEKVPGMAGVVSYFSPDWGNKSRALVEMNNSAVGKKYMNAFFNKCVEYVSFVEKYCGPRAKPGSFEPKVIAQMRHESGLQIKMMPFAYMSAKWPSEAENKKLAADVSKEMNEETQKKIRKLIANFESDGQIFGTKDAFGKPFDLRNAEARMYKRMGSHVVGNQLRCTDAKNAPIDPQMEVCLAKLPKEPVEQKAGASETGAAP